MVVFLSGHGDSFPGIMVPAFWMMTGLTMIAGVSLSLGKLRQWQGWVFVLLFAVMIAVSVRFNQGVAPEDEGKTGTHEVVRE